MIYMSILKTSESGYLTIAFNCVFGKIDEAALVVMKEDGKNVRVVNSFTGKEAIDLYYKLGGGA